LLYPEYAIVVPEPGTHNIPLAYPIACHDQQWRAFIDTWIELQYNQNEKDILKYAEDIVNNGFPSGNT
jgi:hypothetical protein